MIKRLLFPVLIVLLVMGMAPLSALTNPKGTLFFAAFLPQFIDPARSLVVQFMIMAGTFDGASGVVPSSPPPLLPHAPRNARTRALDADVMPVCTRESS